MKPVPNDILACDSSDCPELFKVVLDDYLNRSDSGQSLLRIAPRASKPLKSSGRVGLHHLPELFFQLQGLTDFITPAQRFRLMPDQLGVIPALVAHEEKPMRWSGKDFANVVAMFGRGSISLHLAEIGADGLPTGRFRQTYSPKRRDKILAYLDDLIEADSSATSAANFAASGALTAALAHLRDTLDFPIAESRSEHPKVSLCKNIIATHMSNPDLNVQELARRIGCSADYLSNLFCQQTGRRLTQWLCQQRVERACELLRNSALNISEIAWATGFSDPAYLSRRFKLFTGMTPREYRK